MGGRIVAGLSMKRLLAQRWVPLSHKGLEPYPGVYVLAYSSKRLSGKKLRVGDVFYVGMSNAHGGVRSRIKQFERSIAGGEGHGPGMRFYKDYLGKRTYREQKRGKQLFVACICVPCEVEKNKRTSKDLRIMGKVAAFEYDVMAMIKDKLGREPELNKK